MKKKLPKYERPDYKCPVCGDSMTFYVRSINKNNPYSCYECPRRVISPSHGNSYPESWIELDKYYNPEVADAHFIVNNKVICLSSDYLDDKNSAIWIEKSSFAAGELTFDKLATIPLLPFECMTPILLERRIQTIITFS